MPKFLKGFLVGLITLPLAGFLLLTALYGIQPFYLIYYSFTAEPLPKDIAAYQADPYYYYTDYELSARFLDDDSNVSHNRSFGLFREEPVIEFFKNDYQNVCVQSFDSVAFEVAVTLMPETRQILHDSFAQTDKQFDSHFAAGGFQKRYFIEAGGNMITWFWVSGSGAEIYKKAMQNNPDEPDFILSVPLGQLYNFQFYLANDMTDKPLSGCTPDVKPEETPAWKKVVVPFWKDIEQTN